MAELDFPTTNIFRQYHTYSSENEAEEGKERIGLYTFRFCNGGVTVQRDICGFVEATWNIRRQDCTSKEMLTAHHWTLLTHMSQNSLDKVETRLNALAKEEEEGF